MPAGLALLFVLRSLDLLSPRRCGAMEEPEVLRVAADASGGYSSVQPRHASFTYEFRSRPPANSEDLSGASQREASRALKAGPQSASGKW